MKGLLLIPILCNLAHSSRTTRPNCHNQPESTTSPPSSPITCLHGQSSEFSVTAYPGSACAADILNLLELLPNTPYPLSCPSTPRNPKCFPITEQLPTNPPPLSAPPPPNPKWHDLSSQSALADWTHDDDLRRRRPRRRSPTVVNYKARSVSLRWPDEMTHAVFFVDEDCEYLDDWRKGEVSHVARRREDEGGADQCVVVGGQWGSVEFMREAEWRGWSGRNLL